MTRRTSRRTALAALLAVLALNAPGSPALSRAQAGIEDDGRYRVVAGTMYHTEEPRSENRRRDTVVMVDTWTGRSWILGQDRSWHPLNFGAGQVLPPVPK
ncbi:MAG: hypothetical protein KDE22_11990 [Rhodobacterales bacterium]|nr:hypothetical protein [Rhodobacterales bacterium]